MSPLLGSKRGVIALALVFCSGAGWLFAQDQSASQQVREIFARAAKAVVKIHGVDEHSEICGSGFFVDPTGTIYTAYTVGGEPAISPLNSATRKFRRANSWQTSAAEQPF